MAQKRNVLHNFKLVFRRSRPLTKLVVLAAIVLSMATLLTLHAFLQDSQSRMERLRAAAAALELDNEKIQQLIDQMDTVQGIENIAREELGLVRPDSIVFLPQK
jgi:cell division protein FtsB